MRARSLVPLAVLAGAMVVWLWVRMWFGSLTHVWMTSCLIGAWSPLAAAALFLYVRAIGARDDRVMLAWLARALGMHFVLTWMLGFSDWLRGPPSEPPAWNMDLGAPVALFSFVPAFAISLAAVEWIGRVARRLNEPVLRPAMPHEHALGRPVPFRGVALVNDGTPTSRAPIAPFGIAAAGIVVATSTASAPYWVLPACALPLALITVRNHRGLLPSVASLVALAVMVLMRNEVGDVRAGVNLVFAWPWLATAAVGFYLVAIEAVLRSRAHATH